LTFYDDQFVKKKKTLDLFETLRIIKYSYQRSYQDRETLKIKNLGYTNLVESLRLELQNQHIILITTTYEIQG